MASYHLQVKTVKRSAGRSATAAAAYRAAERIDCAREGRVHDYTRKGGVEEAFIVAPDGAPGWAQERDALWNAVEAKETRVNSVTAREWEIALPAELSPGERRELAYDFARGLVERYGVAADIAIHAPHREGDDRNHHAHILTTTRSLGAEGVGAKTRVLDAAKTGGPEIEIMRGTWAELQNRALERAGERGRVDYRSLEVQRSDALDRGDALAAEALDRAPEAKLGPAVNAMERREQRAAERDGRDYEPVTDRGRSVHEARSLRALYAELRGRAEHAREAWGQSREQGHDRIGAGLAALRAAAAKHEGRQAGTEHERGAGETDIDRGLARLRGAGEPQRDPAPDREQMRDRLNDIRARPEQSPPERAEPSQEDRSEREGARDGPSLADRLRGVLERAQHGVGHEDERRESPKQKERARDEERARAWGRDRDDGGLER